MPDLPWPESLLHAFHEAAQSLKLYRRADLFDPEVGSPLIEALYVDPLASEQVFRTILKPNTTFVVGRKGTGKSTVFQRLQAELRKSKIHTSAYLDIKTIYESSQIDAGLKAKLEKLDLALPSDTVDRLLLYKEFLKAVVLELKKELTKRVQASLWERIKETFTGNLSELFEGLDEVVSDADAERFISVVGIRTVDQATRSANEQKEDKHRQIAGELGAEPSLKVDWTDKRSSATSSSVDSKFADILIRVLDIKGLLARLNELLGQLGVKHLFVIVDDFSELPEEAMRVVVDVLLAPLNNWSEEFIKFKIAAYPGRIYYGAIDKTKVDEVYLDLYKLYGTGDVGRMEDSATDFTRRLVTQRIEHFCRVAPSEFFEGSEDEVWNQLFFASMGNPRNLGYLLHYLHESQLIRGKRIGLRAIQEAAQRYFEEKVEAYFLIGKFLHETFGERSSIFSLKELLEHIVERARELRHHESEVIRKIKGRPPTSHFHVARHYEALLATLELNFFLTKYFEMKDRDGRMVTIFALNYGLCAKHSIRFGRPTGEREFRLYFVERIFDYSPLLVAYMAKNQEITCEQCGYQYALEHLDALKFYGMRCRECGDGLVRVTNLSRKYAEELERVNSNLLLPATELGILHALHSEATPMRAATIAEELDCSWQLIGWRGRHLAERGLVKRSKNPSGHRIFEITEQAEDSYFSSEKGDGLQVKPDAGDDQLTEDE